MKVTKLRKKLHYIGNYEIHNQEWNSRMVSLCGHPIKGDVPIDEVTCKNCIAMYRNRERRRSSVEVLITAPGGKEISWRNILLLIRGKISASLSLGNKEKEIREFVQ